ncbi:MAG TPA: NUDIX domain-containing protein [Solirubrobacteraceae bacterium]|jgi:8-oxo-dGTP pyrophosphatase MutT (NUDIX family)|nr:NUDIX domain-containing protein [Solirubrobacteraceae bacterium]
MSTDAVAEREDFSAGGVVVDGERMIAIVPIKRAADGSKVLGLPKGHPDGDETAEQAATREVSEETGVSARLIAKLGDVEYRYERKGRSVHKLVRFFLFEYEHGDVADHDHEIERAEWITLQDGARRLTYEGEREMVRRAMSLRTADR